MTLTAIHDEPDSRRFQKLVAYGFNLIPLEPRGKKPVISWQAYQNRRSVKSQIDVWSANSLGYNVGIVCGPTSGNRIVLDIDSAGGRVELERRHGPLPTTPTVRTAKGWHLYLIDPSCRLRNFVGKVQGVDLRGMGGYVVGPGSIHPTGAMYRWEPGFSPDDLAFALVPGWLFELAEKGEPELRGELEYIRSILPRALPQWAHPRVVRYAVKALENAVFQVEYAVKGCRNNKLNMAAFSMGRLVATGALDRDQVEQKLYLACDRSGLVAEDGDYSVRSTIRSGITSGLNRPRDLSHLTDPWGRPAR